MRTNKTQATATASFTFDFTPCEEAMVNHYNSGISLSDAVTRVWNSAPDALRQVKPFRDQFTAWAKAAKYGETHIKRVLASFDFLQLRKRTGKANATKAAKKAATPKTPTKRSAASFASEVKAMHLSKTEIMAIITELAKLA